MKVTWSKKQKTWVPVLVPKRHWGGLKSFKAYLESKILGVSDLWIRLTCLLLSWWPCSLESQWQGLRHLFTSSCSESLPSRFMSTSEWSFFLKGSFLPWLLASCLLPRSCDLNGTSMALAQTGHSSSSRPSPISALLSTYSLLVPSQEPLTLYWSVAFRLFLYYSSTLEHRN